MKKTMITDSQNDALVTSGSPKQRRQQERGDATKEKLIVAATDLFTERGFDGVTQRDIETRADVQRGLVKYHFGDKEGLWKAAADNVFGSLVEYRRIRDETAIDLSPRERLNFRIRSFVRYSANCPELNRMMVQEGKRDSWRMRYIIDNYLRSQVLLLEELAIANLAVSREDFCLWYYMYVGGGALMFSMAPEAKHLFDIDVQDPELVDRHAQMMADFLLFRAEGGGGP